MILETIDECDSRVYVCVYVIILFMCICVSIFYDKLLAENNEPALGKIITHDKIFVMYINLFHIKVTASDKKSSHQDRDPCYLHLPIFSYIYTLLSRWKKSCSVCCFHQQIRPQTPVQ